MKTQRNKGYTAAKILAAVGGAALLGGAAVGVATWLGEQKRKKQKPLPKKQKSLPIKQKSLPIKQKPQPKKRRGNKRSQGFSLAEVLMVVGILVILMAVAFVGVNHYRRSLHQMEMDDVAKEIFIAAQNHLTMAQSQGYLGNTVESARGLKKTEELFLGSGKTGVVYYFFVGVTEENPGNGAFANPETAAAKASLLNLMLPFASVDEQVRMGGSYIIRYQYDTATVLDVYYAEKDGKTYGRAFSSGDYGQIMPGETYYGEARKANRGNAFSVGAIIGWYGGAPAAEIATAPDLKDPVVILHNEDTLWVELRDPNTSTAFTQDVYNSLKRQVILTGNTSGNRRQITELTKADSQITVGSVTYDVYTAVLDDIKYDNKRFQAQFCSSDSSSGLENLMPGENITAVAKVFGGLVYATEVTSKTATDNSLFAKESDPWNAVSSNCTATISNFRHLENLDGSKSGYGYWKEGDVSKTVTRLAATQSVDLVWKENDYWHQSPAYAYAPVNSLRACTRIRSTPSRA